MPHGGPDWGTLGPLGTIYTIEDLGELAARLGSIVTFDRRGNVVWLDDFESGIGKWEPYFVGTGAALASTSEAARNGAFSAELTKGTDTSDHTQMGHTWYYPTVSKVGFEVSFTSNGNLTYIIFRQQLFDGTNRHWAELRYDHITNKLQYLDKNEAYQDLATNLVLTVGYYAFHTIKIVIDIATRKYVRVILDNVEYDMSTIDYRVTAPFAILSWVQVVKIDEGIAGNQSICVDDVILTQNEP